MEDEKRRGVLSRRDALKQFALWSGGGLALWGLWKLNLNVHEGEKLRKMNEWEPEVARLLNETVESDRLDNLGILNDSARQQFIGLVSDNQEALYSYDPKISYGSRYNLLAFVLGEHYQLRYSVYDQSKGSEIIFMEESLSFLDRILDHVAYSEIQGKSVESQANMWIEGLLRSYSGVWEHDPTIKDGVYLPPRDMTLFTAPFISYDFVRLQSHP